MSKTHAKYLQRRPPNPSAVFVSLFLDNATIPIYLKQTLLRLSGYNNLFRDSLIPKDLFFKIDFNITYVPFFLCLVELGDEDTGMKYLF